MINHIVSTFASARRLLCVLGAALLMLSACASSDPISTSESAEVAETTTSEASTTTVESDGDSEDTTEAEDTAEPEDSAEPESAPVAAADCDAIAELFVTRGSANADLDDPEVEATCDGDSLVIESNGIPDYTYIETSPGQPRDADLSYTIPATPTVADEVTAVPLLGTAAVTLGGIPIFGPTEGTGGDVESLPGILSDCGSHNGPTGFHIHLILTTTETDCLFTPDEVAAEPQLVGYAFDGFPIYTGIDQYTSSWELTDETLFATDTWAAHTYVEGSGDLDECNGRTDENGNYAYYTTATFPYILGCYTGVVDLDAAGGGGGGGGGGERPERPEGDGGAPAGDEAGAEGDAAPAPAEGDDRPAPPEGDDRPARPEGDDRPAPPEGDDRPAPPEDDGAAPDDGEDA